jgi:hypothetical protein
LRAARHSHPRLFAGRHRRGSRGSSFCHSWRRPFLAHEPLVAGARIRLAIRTDEVAHPGKNAAEGVRSQPGWILGTTATVKVFIDIFIGIWAFILGYIWTNHINAAQTGEKAKIGEIWHYPHENGPHGADARPHRVGRSRKRAPAPRRQRGQPTRKLQTSSLAI